MDAVPAPFPDQTLTALEPLLSEAIHAYSADVSYGVQIVTDGRKAVSRRDRPSTRVKKVAAPLVAAVA